MLSVDTLRRSSVKTDDRRGSNKRIGNNIKENKRQETKGEIGCRTGDTRPKRGKEGGGRPTPLRREENETEKPITPKEGLPSLVPPLSRMPDPLYKDEAKRKGEQLVYLGRALTTAMCRLVFLLALAAIGAAQYRGSPETAAIISDTRYLSGDGTFGSAYTQEDGVEFKEESDADGNRKGSYSYVDPSGQRRTITYTAGKNGFQASGDHLPVPPAPPQPQYQPQPQYRPQQYYQPQPQYAQPQFAAQPQFPAQPRIQPQYASPAQYDDGQYREEYNNPAYRPQVAQPAALPSPQYSLSFGSTPAPVAYNPLPQQFPTIQAQPTAAHRFFPPGKLNLNRTPDGFSYSFNKS